MMTLAQVDAAIDKNENFLKGLRRQYKSQLPNFMARLVDWLKANRDRNTRLLRQSLSDIDILRLFNAGGVAQLVNVEELLARSIESAATLLPETDTFGVLRLSRSAVKQTLDGVVLEVGLQVSQTVEKVQSLVADMVVTPISVKEATARLTTESNLLKRGPDCCEHCIGASPTKTAHRGSRGHPLERTTAMVRWPQRQCESRVLRGHCPQSSDR
jgi:predicted transcriptional regulator